MSTRPALTHSITLNVVLNFGRSVQTYSCYSNIHYINMIFSRTNLYSRESTQYEAKFPHKSSIKKENFIPL